MSDMKKRSKAFALAQANAQMAYINAERMVAELESENTKLHQLVTAVLVLRNDSSYKWLDAAVMEVYGKSFTDAARELGIEATNG